MGHAQPLTRTCGQTVPTFRVTWVLFLSCDLQAGKEQRSGQSTNLHYLQHIPQISQKSKLLLPSALIWTNKFLPLRLMTSRGIFSVGTMESGTHAPNI